jgi:hypothetical protein
MLPFGCRPASGAAEQGVTGMGLFDQGIVKAYENQKKGMLKEAEKAGAAVVGFTQFPEEGDAGEGATGRSLKSAAKSIFGGKMATDAFQILELETAGVRHVFVQPYSGIHALPGEHHVALPGSVPAPVILAKGGLFGGKKWRGPDEAVARRFNECGPLKKVVKKCKWDWYVGTAKIDLDWTVQIRSLGDGHVHVVLKNGRYGGFTTYGVGFAHLIAIGAVLPQVLGTDLSPLQPLVQPTAFEGLALATLLGDVAPPVEGDGEGPGDVVAG